MDLPSNQDVFDFNFTSEVGKKYEGRFTVLCVLDMRTKHRLELEKTRLLGNYPNPTDQLAGIAVMLSTLRLRITDAPEWWKQSDGGNDISDFDALNALYDKVLNVEVEWRTKLKEKAKKLLEPAPAETPKDLPKE
jgi:hypothetical protein